MYIYWEFPLVQKTANIKHTLLLIITHLFIFRTAVLAIHCFASTRKKLQNFDQDKKLPLLPLMLGTTFKKKLILGNEWKYELIHFFSSARLLWYKNNITYTPNIKLNNRKRYRANFALLDAKQWYTKIN